jgi:hypothetical protein
LNTVRRGFREEGFTMLFTMEDFNRQYIKEHFAQPTPEEQREVMERLTPEHRGELFQALPPEKRLVGLSEEVVCQLLDRRASRRTAQARKPLR